MGCDRILLVEDDRDLLDLTAEVIEQLGITVIRCPDAAVALDHLRAGPRPDMVILDLSMPRMSGTELLAIVRADDAWRTIPVVGMSGFPARRFPHLPVDAFISKPFDSAELEAVVARHCGTNSSTTVA